MARRGNPGLLAIVTDLEDMPRPMGGGLRGAGGAGQAEAAQASASAAGQISDELGRVANRIGDWADRAAAKEGAEAGAIAGMDGEFRRGDDWTVFGEAYNKAQLETYGARVRTEVDGAIQADIDADVDLDTKLANLNTKRQNWLKEVPPELKPEVDAMFTKGTFLAQRQAARIMAARSKAEAAASVDNEVAVALRGIHQNAYLAGLDKTADNVLAGELVRVSKIAQRVGADGAPLLKPEAAAKLMRDAKQEVTTARILGAFDRQGSTADKEKMLADLQDGFASSKGPAAEYDLDGFRALRATLSAQINREKTQSETSVRETMKRVASLEDRVDKGYVPPPEEMKSVAAAVAGTGDADAAIAMRQVEGYLAWANEARTKSPDQLRAEVEAVDRALQAGGATADQMKFHEKSKKLLGEMEGQIKADPHGWAERSGVLAATPIDFSSPDAAAESIRRRAAAAETLTRKWNRDVGILRPNEVTAAAAAIAEGGKEGLRMISKISTAAGEAYRLKVFEEIGKEAPALAWLGALAVTTGNPEAPGSITRDVMDGLALAKVDGHKSRGPKPEEMRTAASPVLGDVFRLVPANEAAVMALANAAYEVRAARAGTQSFNPELWQRGLKEVLGETTWEGKTWGGVVASRGNGWRADDRMIQLPPYVRQDAWREVFDVITAEDLASAGIPRPVDSAGEAVTMKRFKSGDIEQTGVSTFRFVVTDPVTGARGAIGAQGGGVFEIDLNRLRPVLAKRRADLFLPGGR